MSFVGLVPEEQASPFLRGLYQQVREKMGFLPNYFQEMLRPIFSVNDKVVHMTVSSISRSAGKATRSLTIINIKFIMEMRFVLNFFTKTWV